MTAVHQLLRVPCLLVLPRKICWQTSSVPRTSTLAPHLRLPRMARPHALPVQTSCRSLAVVLPPRPLLKPPFRPRHLQTRHRVRLWISCPAHRQLPLNPPRTLRLYLNPNLLSHEPNCRVTPPTRRTVSKSRLHRRSRQHRRAPFRSLLGSPQQKLSAVSTSRSPCQK